MAKIGDPDQHQLERRGLAGPDREVAEPVRDGSRPEPARLDRQACDPGLVGRQGRLGGDQEPARGLDGALAAVHRPAARHRAVRKQPREPRQPLRRLGQRRVPQEGAEARRTSPRCMVLPPAPEMLPWHYPANGRFAEHEPILLNEFIKVTLGQSTVEQYAENSRQADPGDPGQADRLGAVWWRWHQVGRGARRRPARRLVRPPSLIWPARRRPIVRASRYP